MGENASQSLDFDERETEDGTSSPERIPCYRSTPGGVTRLSTIMQVAGPTRGAVHFLHGRTEGFGQIGPDLDSTRSC